MRPQTPLLAAMMLMPLTLGQGLAWAASGGEVPLPDTGQTTSYTNTVGEDHDYVKPRGYTDNGNGTVTDTVTKLVWQQEDDNTTRTWEEAITYCEGLTLAGYTDWRLPTVKELTSLVNANKSSLTIDTTAFPGTDASWYWSSTTNASDSSGAWYIGFDVGGVDDSLKTYANYVRCLRS